MSAYVKNSACLRVLYIPLEFKTWQNASHFPYPSNFAFEEGFAANGVEYLTIPALYETTSSNRHHGSATHVNSAQENTLIRFGWR